MKKLDIIFISIISIIVISLLFIFAPKVKVNDDVFYIDIKYENTLLKEISITDEGIYKIESINGKLNLYKNDDVLLFIEIGKEINFHNIIKIENGKVLMIDASCSGKDCMNMYITKSHLLPIICTNGVIVIPKEKSNIDIVI